jgi:hypothetical protein
MLLALLDATADDRGHLLNTAASISRDVLSRSQWPGATVATRQQQHPAAVGVAAATPCSPWRANTAHL